MAAVIDICNAGLVKIGARRVTATYQTNPTSEEERLCNEHFDRLRDAMLRENIWNFAKKYVALAADATAPVWNWDNQFTMPSDWIRVLELEEGNSFEVAGNKILTDYEAPLKVSYIARITDPNQWDPLFRDAMAARIGYEFAERLKQADAKKSLAFNEYQEILGRAAQVDALENPAVAFPEDIWITARA